MKNQYDNFCVTHFEGKAIFICDDNEVYFIDDKTEALTIGSSIEKDALRPIDELSEQKVAEILTKLERL